MTEVVQKIKLDYLLWDKQCLIVLDEFDAEQTHEQLATIRQFGFTKNKHEITKILKGFGNKIKTFAVNFEI